MRIYYDFHLHSALSPCGDGDMTPNNIVNMAKIMGLDVIALTDHNSCKNCRAAINVGENAGLTVIPGMELCTAEEVHVVCLFPEISAAEEFSEYIKTTVPPIKNKPSVFGEQLIMNENDEVTGVEETLLVTASSLGINRVCETVSKFGGFSFPAHIDRSSYSIISNLGAIDESLGFTAAEIFVISKEGVLKEKHPFLNTVPILSSSDAHYLENMRAASLWIEAKDSSAKAVINALKNLSRKGVE